MQNFSNTMQNFSNNPMQPFANMMQNPFTPPYSPNMMTSSQFMFRSSTKKEEALGKAESEDKESD